MPPKLTKVESAIAEALQNTLVFRVYRMKGTDKGTSFVKDAKRGLGMGDFSRFIAEMHGLICANQKGEQYYDYNAYEKAIALIESISSSAAFEEEFNALFEPSYPQKRRVRQSLAIVPLNPAPTSRISSKDMLNSIVPHLKYRPLGHLIKACKWTRGNIAKQHVDKCKERAKLTIGKCIPIPHQRFGVVFRIHSLDEEAVEIALYHPRSLIFVCKVRGKDFIAGAISRGDDSMLSLLNTYQRAHAKGKEHKDKVKFIFRHYADYSDQKATLFFLTKPRGTTFWDTECLEMHPFF